MKIYFDENLPPKIARGLNILKYRDDIEVLNIVDEFGRGSADEEWIPRVGMEGGVVVTQDRNIHRIRQQRELYKECNLGIFLIKPPSKTGYKYWELVRFIIDRWDMITEMTGRTKRPFGFILKARSFNPINIDEM
jgi:hypothetical protein